MRVADDEPAKLVGPNGAGPGRAARDANARAGTAYAVTAGADPDARGTSGAAAATSSPSFAGQASAR